MKVCFKCEEGKPFSEFYKHKRMGDGYLGKCKSCTKIDSTTNRNNNLDRIRAYDRKRGSRQDKGYLKIHRDKYPTQYKAQTMVGNAIRDGKLFRQPCEVCQGAEVHAHHDDYAKPLNVRWLCPSHHKQWHRDNGEAFNR